MAAVALALTACGGDEAVAPVAVPAPAPTADAAVTACSNLATRLPVRIDGEPRRETTRESDRTAAWGDPPVALRCGVPRPAGLTATSFLHTVDGLDWYLVEEPDRRVFTTVGRVARVEVTIPLSHEPAVGPLVDVAGAIRQTVPAQQVDLPLPTDEAGS